MRRGVLVVDDNALVRRSVRMLFEPEHDFEVWGEAEHGLDAVEKATHLKPHLIVLDFAMPVMNGLDAAPLLLEKLPQVILIMLTLYADPEMEVSVRNVGIHALIAKEHAATRLLPAARALFVETAGQA
jgi:DNA-binding NarL/FixJ family response regulator